MCILERIYIKDSYNCKSKSNSFYKCNYRSKGVCLVCIIGFLYI